MSWQFNPPPGWPQQPEGWVPPPGWTPDPAWPPAPAGWQFWVPAAALPAAPQAPTTSGPPAAYGQTTPTPQAPTTSGPPAAYGQTTPTPQAPTASGPVAPFARVAASAPAGYATAVTAPGQRVPWFRRWWAYLVLLLLLLIGVGAGFGATWLVITVATNVDDTIAAPDPAPGSAGVPSPSLPAISPPPGPIGGLPDDQLCGDVAVIMLTMATAALDGSGSFDEYQDTLIDSRRTAAGELRQLDAADTAQRDALDTLAGELDAAAQLVEDNRDQFTAIDDSFNLVSTAYADFNTAIC